MTQVGGKLDAIKGECRFIIINVHKRRFVHFTSNSIVPAEFRVENIMLENLRDNGYNENICMRWSVSLICTCCYRENYCYNENCF